MTAAPPRPSRPAAPEAAQSRAGARLLADLRVELARADTKATVLVGVLGITAAALGTLLTSRGSTLTRLSAPAALLWWTGGAALIAALLALLLAVVPRHSRHAWAPGRPLTYFGDIHRATRSGCLSTALHQTDGEPHQALLLALAETSRIAARKNFWIRAGLTAFGSASVLLPAALLID
ncbi:Pycsar system effector family protein [Streptomyces cavernicola]|uniref:DUF5706 domain-containing protein n=1 Tax=Streptomyces cavernicola TaxID=3043613 RepID=A0ABT6SK02_9ACTN|nr:Pycsar system effector family protein [Streptomyces sp. B-S-A6]MDI3408527.1 DUF5706 domain-containing protein [Streptomyces sp. B-S-A6]